LKGESEKILGAIEIKKAGRTLSHSPLEVDLAKKGESFHSIKYHT